MLIDTCECVLPHPLPPPPPPRPALFSYYLYYVVFFSLASHISIRPALIFAPRSPLAPRPRLAHDARRSTAHTRHGHEHETRETRDARHTTKHKTRAHRHRPQSMGMDTIIHYLYINRLYKRLEFADQTNHTHDRRRSAPPAHAARLRFEIVRCYIM